MRIGLSLQQYSWRKIQNLKQPTGKISDGKVEDNALNAKFFQTNRNTQWSIIAQNLVPTFRTNTNLHVTVS